jgi:uncharacterized protein (TIGR03067 family)
MKTLCIACGCLAFLLGAADKDDSKVDPKAELKKLEGNWQVSRQEDFGNLVPKPIIANLRIVIEGDSIAWYIGNPAANQTADFTIDPTKEPKTIDAEITKGSAIGKKMLGIYKLDKDTLEICWGVPGSDKRPTKFTTRPGVGAGNSYATYKREKDK